MRSVDKNRLSTVLERQLYSMEFSSGHCNGLMENRDVLSDRVLRQFIIVLEATILCITIPGPKTQMYLSILNHVTVT